ncbi:ATP-binding cassette domain-containing protein [Tsukamurella sp. 1534]|uniref:ATP-binding cassette domain-containing protein n=1 Tax=Tsukamurella sp. 1534 TaxID=1151061 RepID=UPI00059381EB
MSAGTGSGPTPPGERAPLIRMRGVTKRFPGVVALDDVSLDVFAGERVALVGENGAGNASTLVQHLLVHEKRDPLSSGGRIDPVERRQVVRGRCLPLVDEGAVDDRILDVLSYLLEDRTSFNDHRHLHHTGYLHD